MAEIETQPKPCPICGEMPKVERFTVNPMFGGGIAFEAKCACGFGAGVAYRDVDVAIDAWNAFVYGWDDMDDEWETE